MLNSCVADIKNEMKPLKQETIDGVRTKLKSIPTLLIRPSVDLGILASEQFRHFPGMLRYLLKGIGATEERGADLLSYIAFDKAYTSKLVEIGIKDAYARKKEIRAFFELEP